MRVERPQGVERAVADLDVRLVHQLAQLHVRRGLVHRRQGRQGVGPELGELDHRLAQDLDAGGVVEVGQGLGREEADLGVGALEALLERLGRRGAQPLELHRGHAARLGIEQLLAPRRRPLVSQRGGVDHGQELDDPEEPLLVLVIDRRDVEHEVAVGLGRSRPPSACPPRSGGTAH